MIHTDHYQKDEGEIEFADEIELYQQAIDRCVKALGVAARLLSAITIPENNPPPPATPADVVWMCFDMADNEIPADSTLELTSLIALILEKKIEGIDCKESPF